MSTPRRATTFLPTSNAASPKGYHVWIFFEGDGVLAARARLFVRRTLEEIEAPNTEVLPKQDSLSDSTTYGNFINAPLFGALVPQGRTVFINQNLNPYPDQWDFLDSVCRVSAKWLEQVTDLNEWEEVSAPATPSQADKPQPPEAFLSGFRGLPPCARRILTEGVSRNQRVTCCRLAVQLRKVGLPEALATVTLEAWASRNRPSGCKRIITAGEVRQIVSCAYSKPYRSCGCEDPAIAPFCDSTCPVKAGRRAAACKVAAPRKTTRRKPAPRGVGRSPKGENCIIKPTINILAAFSRTTDESGHANFTGVIEVAGLRKTKAAEIEVVLIPIESVPKTLSRLVSRNAVSKDGLVTFAGDASSENATRKASGD